jgi:hypothetical protein
MTTFSPFKVIFATAPCNGGKGKYRRPMHIRVIDTRQSYWHAVRGLNEGVKAIWRNRDSRYSGPRSEFGQACAAAQQLADELNAREQAEISACCVI